VTAPPAIRSPFRWRRLSIGGSTIWMLMLAAFVMTGNIGERLAGTGLILDDLLYAFSTAVRSGS